MKRVLSSNNIPLIINGKYAWKIMNDKQYGEYFQITLGNSYLDINDKDYDLIYLPKDKILWIYIGLFFDEYYRGTEKPRITMNIEFENIGIIIDGLLKANKLKLLPLYDGKFY